MGRSARSPRILAASCAKRSAVVIGGGIHGVTAAIALAEAGVSVTLVERDRELMRGTSSATHNRAHMGYHYPRSARTVRECIAGLSYFQTRYPEALMHPRENYYAIEKESKISADDYQRFMDRFQLSYKPQWPNRTILAANALSACFLVSEPCFNLKRLSDSLLRSVAEQRIQLLLGCRLVSGERRRDKHELTVCRASDHFAIDADLVVNATYAYSNNVLAMCGIADKLTPCAFDITEVAVVRHRGCALPALTILDGPFQTLLPDAGQEDLMLLYDVTHSVHARAVAYFFQPPPGRVSNWPAMRERGRRYFPFMDDLEHVDSRWGARPMPVRDARAARFTTIVAHRSSSGFYSIRGGKFVSAPLIAARLVERLRSEQLL